FPTLINARSEEVLVKASFRNAMRWRRCLVPADGFYEWTGEKGKRRPFLLRPREPHLIAFAGITSAGATGRGRGRYRHDPDLSFQSHGNGSARPHACSFGSRAFRDVARREGNFAGRSRRIAEARSRRSVRGDRDAPEDQRL